MKALCVLGAVLGAVGCRHAPGEIVYLSQTRSTSAAALPEASTELASGFEPFSSSVSALSLYGTQAFASQSSTLVPESMFVSGGASAFGGMQFFPADGQSTFDVAFLVTAAGPFRFWGGIDASQGRSPATCTAVLRGPSGVLLSREGSSNWDLSGIAEAGTYQLRVFMSAHAAGITGSSAGSFFSGFAVPAPGAALAVLAAGASATRRRR